MSRRAPDDAAWEWLESFNSYHKAAAAPTPPEPTTTAPHASPRADGLRVNAESIQSGGRGKQRQEATRVEQRLLWPPDVEYLKSVDLSQVATADISLILTARLPGVQTRFIDSPLHPCYG